MTPATLCIGLVLAPVFTDAAAKFLAADVKKALEHAVVPLKVAAIELDVPLNKLSDQLNGKAPFTYCWRFFAWDDADPTVATHAEDFKKAFLNLQADRIGAVLVQGPDLCDLVRSVRELISRVPHGNHINKRRVS